MILIQDDPFDRYFPSVCAGVCCGFSAFGCEGGAPASLGGSSETPVKKARVARRCSNKRFFSSLVFRRARAFSCRPLR